MTSLVRAGVWVFVLGLSLAALWAVAFGATTASTEVACPDAPREYSLARVDPATATVWVDDGCNDHQIARPVVVGLSGVVAGTVIGGVGLIGRKRGDASFRYY